MISVSQEEGVGVKTGLELEDVLQQEGLFGKQVLLLFGFRFE